MESSICEIGGLSAAGAYLRDNLGVAGGVCPFCGGEAEMDLFEVWDSRNFQVSTCCEGMHQMVCEQLADGGRESARILDALGMSSLGLGRVRRVVDDGCGHMIVDWQLALCDVQWKEAKEFVALHHEHCPAPVGWKFGAGIRNGRDLIGVVTVGRPVARAYDARKYIVEVNRLCVRRDIPSGLVWNACSMAYGYAAREAKKRNYAVIVTYTLESEDATTLKAAGWTFDGITRGGSRSCPSRPRVDKTSIERKVRWKKVLRELRPSERGMLPQVVVPALSAQMARATHASTITLQPEELALECRRSGAATAVATSAFR